MLTILNHTSEGAPTGSLAGRSCRSDQTLFFRLSLGCLSPCGLCACVYSFGQGYLIGFAGGGWLVERIGWQDTFVLVGAPQCLLAAFFHLTVPSPPAAKPKHSVVVDMQQLFRKVQLRVLWAGIFFTTLGSAMHKFLPSFYQRVHGTPAADHVPAPHTYVR